MWLTSPSAQIPATWHWRMRTDRCVCIGHLASKLVAQRPWEKTGRKAGGFAFVECLWGAAHNFFVLRFVEGPKVNPKTNLTALWVFLWGTLIAPMTRISPWNGCIPRSTSRTGAPLWGYALQCQSRGSSKDSFPWAKIGGLWSTAWRARNSVACRSSHLIRWSSRKHDPRVACGTHTVVAKATIRRSWPWMMSTSSRFGTQWLQQKAPTCLIWGPENIYFDDLRCKLGYMSRSFDSESSKVNRSCRKTALAPTYGGPITRMTPVYAEADGEEQFMLYATHEKVLGLVQLPLDGNPNKCMGLIAHPGGSGFWEPYFFSMFFFHAKKHFLLVGSSYHILGCQVRLPASP